MREAGREGETMSDIVCRITFPCYAPNGEAVLHEVTIDADGTVATPTHDAEEWPHYLDIMEALGGEGDASPCVWWKAITTRPAGAIGDWRDGGIYAFFRRERGSASATYHIADWNLNTEAAWTPAALHTLSTGLSLGYAYGDSLPLPDDHVPRAVVTILKSLPHEQLNGRLSMVRLINTAEALEASGTALQDWLDQGRYWFEIVDWIRFGFSPEEAGAFQEAFLEAFRKLDQRFGRDVLNTMVQYKTNSLIEALIDHQVPRERFIPLLKRAPQVLFPDWPGVAEAAMPPLPEGTPPYWVHEALASIPAAGFLPDIDRTTYAKSLVRTLPQRFIDEGDPSTWDPQWCWPSNMRTAPVEDGDL